MVEVVGIRIEVEEDAAVRAFRNFGRVADNELERVERSAKDTDRAVERVGKEGGLSLKQLAAAATAAWAAFQGAQEVIGFLSDGVDAASNYAESLSKLEVIVGGVAASDLADWAESAATTIGATSDQALEMTGTMANLLKTVGTAPDQIGPMSADIVELGADLASFHNVAGGTPEVLEKIRAGLVGEAEPLRTLGVLLSAARVEEEAYASGIAERGEKLTEAQKVQARYNIILQDTIDAQGDFARTSDGLANSTRILQANIGDLQREIGEALIPVVADATSFLNNLFTSDQERATARYRREINELTDAMLAVEGVSLSRAEAELIAIHDALRRAAANGDYEAFAEFWRQFKDAGGEASDGVDAFALAVAKFNEQAEEFEGGYSGLLESGRAALKAAKEGADELGVSLTGVTTITEVLADARRRGDDQYTAAQRVVLRQMQQEYMQLGYNKQAADVLAAVKMMEAEESVPARVEAMRLRRDAIALLGDEGVKTRELTDDQRTYRDEIFLNTDAIVDQGDKSEDAADTARAAVNLLREEYEKAIGADPFADLNASLGRVSEGAALARAEIIAAAAAIQIAEVQAAGFGPMAEIAMIDQIFNNAVARIQSYNELTAGSVQDWRERIKEIGMGTYQRPGWTAPKPGTTTTTTGRDEGPTEFEGDPTAPVGTDLMEDPQYDVFDGSPKPGTVGGDLIDAVDNLYDLPEGVEAMANLREIMTQGTDDQRSYFQMLHDDLAEDGFTQQEIKMLLEQSGPIVTAIEAGRADAKAAAASQAALQIRALEEGGIQLYNALVEGGVIDAPMLDAPAPDRGPEAPVFTRADGTRYVQIGSALKGYRNVELDQGAITAAGAEHLALNQHAYGAFPGALAESDREGQASVNAALNALVKWAERDARSNEQIAANTASDRRSSFP